MITKNRFLRSGRVRVGPNHADGGKLGTVVSVPSDWGSTDQIYTVSLDSPGAANPIYVHEDRMENA